MNSFSKLNIIKSFIMCAFITSQGEHMHEFNKLVRLKFKLFSDDNFICRFHTLVKVFDFAKSKYIYKNPKGDIAMLGHIVSNDLVVFIHLTSNFLLYIANEFYGRCDSSLIGDIKVFSFKIIVVTVFG